MGCFSIFLIPSAGVSFFFSSWLTMIFWGMIAPDVGIGTISYVQGMLVTVALWMIIVPLVWSVARNARKK